MRKSWSVCGIGLFACLSASAAVPGFVQDFNGGTTAGWGGGSESYAAIGSGGVGGLFDGYLEVANIAFPGRLGTAAGDFGEGLSYTGDLTADGVYGFSFWLNDVGADDNLEIHVGVGAAFSNFWLYAPGFVPPDNDWAKFTVDFTNPADWVQIIGIGTFEDALAASSRLLIRHDFAPIMQEPDLIQGDVGIDRITVLSGPALFGDHDGDEDVDLDDHEVFAECMDGPSQAPGMSCSAFDADADVDIDLADFAALQVAFTG